MPLQGFAFVGALCDCVAQRSENALTRIGSVPDRRGVHSCAELKRRRPQSSPNSRKRHHAQSPRDSRVTYTLPGFAAAHRTDESAKFVRPTLIAGVAQSSPRGGRGGRRVVAARRQEVRNG